MQYQTTTLLPLIEKAISGFSFPLSPSTLYDPIRYFMDLPGKRIRPIFVLQCLELFRKPEAEDALASLATELFHNFSLVHDDIMDKADVRRGFQTVHIKWNEPTALLAGDALLVFAYEALLASKTKNLGLYFPGLTPWPWPFVKVSNWTWISVPFRRSKWKNT